MKLLVTGGCGFIGSNFIRYWLKKHPKDQIINLDKLTYAGHLSSTQDFADNPNYRFVQGDICDQDLVEKSVAKVDVIIHFAAESHVDRSILDPMSFVKTNVLGTTTLLNAALKYQIKRFHQVSSDEVFGHLGPDDKPFDEATPLNPRTPYAASKASADLLVKSYFTTYGLPVTLSNCANNYGPYHDPEKLIPRFITHLLQGKRVPLMGKGQNIREWLYVEDHTKALDLILKKGNLGQTYCIGGEARTNLEVTKSILRLLNLDQSMIEYVEHRLGHDFRYAINDQKIKKLGWKLGWNFENGLTDVVKWYKKNEWWWKPLLKNRPTVDRVAQRGYV